MAELELPEPPKDGKEKEIGLVIAIIAIVLAVNTAFGNKAGDDEIIARVEASNTWSFYQAKRIRRAQTELTQDLVKLDTIGEDGEERKFAEKLLSEYKEEIRRYKLEGDTIQQQARDFSAAAEKSAAKGDKHDLADIFLQIAIVLCSIAVLTGQSLFYRMGIGIAAVGAGFVIYAFIA
jgi:hypothetical protein